MKPKRKQIYIFECGCELDHCLNNYKRLCPIHRTRLVNKRVPCHVCGTLQKTGILSPLVTCDKCKTEGRFFDDGIKREFECGHKSTSYKMEYGRRRSKKYCPICFPVRKSYTNKIAVCGICGKEGRVGKLHRKTTKFVHEHCIPKEQRYTNEARIAAAKARARLRVNITARKKAAENRYDCLKRDECSFEHAVKDSPFLPCFGCDQYAPSGLNILEYIHVGNSFAETPNPGAIS